MTAATNEGIREAMLGLKQKHIFPPNVPQFNPTHDPIIDYKNSKDYLENFEFQCKNYEIEDLAKAFSMVCGTRVRKLLKHVAEPENGTEWEKLKSKFQSQFQYDDMDNYFTKQFQSTNQKEGESDVSYILRLQELILDVKYTDSTDPAEIKKVNEKQIMIQVASGALNKEFQKEALKSKMTLQKLIECAKTNDATKVQLQAIRSTSSSSVRKIYGGQQGYSGYSKPKPPTDKGDCFFCGNGVHDRKRCPANGVKCAACGKDNHLKPMCRNTRRQSGKVSKPYKGRPNYTKNVHRIQESYPSESSDNETTEQQSNCPEEDNYYYSSDSSYNTDEMATCFVRHVKKQPY